MMYDQNKRGWLSDFFFIVVAPAAGILGVIAGCVWLYAKFRGLL